MSELSPCRVCGHQVAKGAKTCPSCGAERPAGNPATLVRFLGAFLAFVLVYYAFDCGGAAPTPPLPPPGPTASAQQGTQLLSHKWAFTEYGTPVIQARIKNTTNTSFTLVTVTWSLYGKNGDLVGSALDVVNHLAPGETWASEASVLQDNVARYELASIFHQTF